MALVCHLGSHCEFLTCQSVYISNLQSTGPGSVNSTLQLLQDSSAMCRMHAAIACRLLYYSQALLAILT